MPTITLDGTGVSKASLVEGAYDFCGLNGFEYERTPEEMTTGLRHLTDIAAELLADGVDLGFDFPTYAHGTLEEPSGIPAHANGVVKQLLAQRICPALGATLSDDAKASLNRSYLALRSRTAAAPVSMIQASTMPSSGVRHSNRRRLTEAPIVGDPGDLAAIVES
jgi:hypothetical protein